MGIEPFDRCYLPTYILNCPIIENETKSQISCLGNNTAPGPDVIPSEFLTRNMY